MPHPHPPLAPCSSVPYTLPPVTGSIDSGLGAGASGVYPWTPLRLYRPDVPLGMRHVSVDSGLLVVSYLTSGNIGDVLFGVAAGPMGGGPLPRVTGSPAPSDLAADGALDTFRRAEPLGYPTGWVCRRTCVLVLGGGAS
jgi:hypothetical protein